MTYSSDLLRRLFDATYTNFGASNDPARIAPIAIFMRIFFAEMYWLYDKSCFASSDKSIAGFSVSSLVSGGDFVLTNLEYHTSALKRESVGFGFGCVYLLDATENSL